MRKIIFLEFTKNSLKAFLNSISVRKSEFLFYRV